MAWCSSYPLVRAGANGQAAGIGGSMAELEATLAVHLSNFTPAWLGPIIHSAVS